MYPYFHELLSDKTGGEIFTCFGLWHFFWIAVSAALFTGLFCLLRRQDGRRRERTVRGLFALAFGLYILDFFLMPLAYGEIDIEKLPFHACTAMCVMCFLSRRSRFLRKFRASFALLGFLSNFVYLMYPAGVMWHGVHPLCYRVIQTLFFHGLMTAACLTALVFGETGSWRRNLTVTAAMTGWAMVSNYIYNSPARLYNWFFVVRDPFGILPAETAPFVMPVLNTALFFALGQGVCAVLRRLKGEAHALR